jgi:hypothetical protein
MMTTTPTLGGRRVVVVDVLLRAIWMGIRQRSPLQDLKRGHTIVGYLLLTTTTTTKKKKR